MVLGINEKFQLKKYIQTALVLVMIWMSNLSFFIISIDSTEHKQIFEIVKCSN